MQNDFSFIELRIIQSMIKKQSYLQIAAVVDRPVEMIAEYVSQYLKGKDILTFQQGIDEKILRKRKAILETADGIARNNELKRLLRSREDQRLQKRRRVEPSFADRIQDYSTMVAIRIDNKTIIYARPGEDVQKVKQKFIDKMKHHIPAVVPKHTVVKKFKPV